VENPYNQVRYQGSPFPQAHINRMAVNAILNGFDAPSVTRCKVLELGCGDGSHLIPMAIDFPESQFVGVDLAEMPITRATELAAELGLENVHFRVGDVAQLGGQPGECDYLIAHGLYSWVSPAVQEKVLELAGRVLAPNGVAYISYNAYPAWHIREMTRNMARIQCAGIDDPVEIRNRTVALLAAIYRCQAESEPYREAMRAEMERIIAKDPNLCYHDDFGEYNLPVYVSEFIRRASEHALQYLSDSEPMNTTDFTPDTVETLNQIGDVISREQLYDFLTLRGFRRTLLCRSDVVLRREVSVDRLKRLYYAAALKPEPEVPDLATFAAVQFRAANGSSITVNQPFVKAVLWELSRLWPGSVDFDGLTEQARAVAPLLSPEEAAEMVREVLLRLHLPGVLELAPVPYGHPSKPSEKPVAGRMARVQIRHASRVTSLRHRPVDLDDDLGKRLVPLLDGSRDREALRAAASEEDSELTAEQVEEALQRLSELCLLEA
jgi:SAM-dependent methyltransferase/methyltransferase-like protein